MRILKGLILVAVASFVISSCTKDKIVPTVAETSGVTLAGAKGSSKSWKLSSASSSQSGGTEQAVALNTCLLDNVYKFSNNSTQDFQHTEGTIKCTSSDPNIVEDGSWAFTVDGKNLLFDGTPYSSQNLFTTLGTPVVSRIFSRFEHEAFLSYLDSNNATVVIYLNFVKV